MGWTRESLVADIVFNPSVGQDLDALPADKVSEMEGWTCKASSEEGDLNIFWFGGPTYEVVGFGVLRGEVDVQDNSAGRYDWTAAKTVFFGDFEPMVVLEHPIGIKEIKQDPLLKKWWATKPFRGQPKTMLNHPTAIRRLLEVIGNKNPYARSILRPYLDALPRRPDSSTARPSRGAGPGTVAALKKAISRLDGKDQRRMVAEIVRAVRERALRPLVIRQWGGACAACGLVLRRESLYECEVAHVMAVSDNGPDRVSNALPLCRRHHWAFDNHLWAMRPDMTMAVVDAEGESDEERKARRALIRELDGKRLRPGLASTPARRILGARYVKHRWAQFQSKNSSV